MIGTYIPSLKTLFYYSIPLSYIGEEAYQRLRDKYARAKKAMKEKCKSGTSSKAVAKVKAKFESLRFVQWLDEFIKPRKAKSNLEAEDENTAQIVKAILQKKVLIRNHPLTALIKRMFLMRKKQKEKTQQKRRQRLPRRGKGMVKKRPEKTPLISRQNK